MEKASRGDRGREDEGLNPSLLKINDLDYFKTGFRSCKKSLENLKTVQSLNYLFYSHIIIGGVIFPLGIICVGGGFNGTYTDIMSIINLVLGICLNGKNNIFSKKRFFWLGAYFVGPHLLGQSIRNTNAFTKSAHLAFYHFSITSVYSKNDAINVITTLLSLVASLFLVLDWMRWWQDYPLPILNAIALGHVLTATYICL